MKTQQQKFEEIMLPHLNALYRSALAMTRNPSDADDLVQDTYVRAFQYFDKFEGGTNARAWLFRILTNLFINTYRKKNREPDNLSLDDSEEFFLYNRLANTESNNAQVKSPEVDVFRRLDAETVNKAIESLPDDYRETVILADINEFSYQEIADMLDIPIGTVRSRLFRGRRLVQKATWEALEEKNTQK
jgi:RNA polymerase sigma-70 factor, ECF subfamily